MTDKPMKEHLKKRSEKHKYGRAGKKERKK